MREKWGGGLYFPFFMRPKEREREKKKMAEKLFCVDTEQTSVVIEER